MLSSNLKEKAADAVLDLQAAIRDIKDYREFPILLESAINKLFPIDWLAMGVFGLSNNAYNVATNPCLPFDWNEKYVEIYDIDKIRIDTLNLPVGDTYIYHRAYNPNSGTERQALEIIKKYTDTSQFLTMHCAKTDAFDSAMGLYRTDAKFRFAQHEKQILDYLSPAIVSIFNTMMLYSELDYKRTALDSLLNDHSVLSMILNDKLEPMEIPSKTEMFFKQHFSEAGRCPIPAPVSKWIKDVIAPEGCLKPNTGPWVITLSLADMELVCKAYAVVTELNQWALLIRLMPHHRSITFDALSAIGLTAREIEAVSYLPLGYSNKQIAMAMEIEDVTVKKHLKNASSKLEAVGRTDTLYRAIKKKELLETQRL